MSLRTSKHPYVVALAAASVAGCIGVSSTQWFGVVDAIASTPVNLSWPTSVLLPESRRTDWAAGAYIGYTYSENSHEDPTPTIDDSLVTIRDVQRHMRAGDEQRTLAAAQAITRAQKWGRDRDAAWFVQGVIHRDHGRHNEASAAFTKVRSAKGPLAPWGAYYEAEQDLVRGKPGVAIRECETYLNKWPNGLHTDACQRLIARGLAETGQYTKALEAATAYDATHPRATIAEQIEFTIASHQVTRNTSAGVRRLKRLAVDHQAPLTGRMAEELLAELHHQGHDDAVIPRDVESIKQRAESLRVSGRRQEAWKTFQLLVEASADDPTLTAWIEEQADVFGWSTRHWAFLETFYRARYADRATSKDAWNLYRVLSRNGKWTEAADWALKAQSKHRTSTEWRRSHEDVARILLMAKRYREARKMFDAVKARGGWQGRRAEFFGAFAAFSADEYTDALARFTRIIDRNSGYQVESRYWRAKTLVAMERHGDAEHDWNWIREHEPFSWYATLMEQSDATHIHAGTWFGDASTPLPASADTTNGTTIPAANWARPIRAHSVSAFGLIRWPLEGSVLTTVTAESILAYDPLFPPPSYRDGFLFTEADGERAFRTLSTTYGDTWSELPAIYDLSRAGLYEWSGPAFSRWFDTWQHAKRYRSRQHHDVARTIQHSQEDWRKLFMYTRDHFHSFRYVNKLETNETDDQRIDEIITYQYPLAHARHVWKYSHEANIDPYMILGLMRQESNYNPIAVSRVGARGAMQIMPRTGHLLADLQGDLDFTAGDLEDPILAVDYGIQYFGLLMKRYDNVFPLAIASYNAGPHNVSSWLAGAGSDMPLDEFVEHIPFRETRGYVKKVVSGYTHYVQKYVGDDAVVMIPATPDGNHQDVVDF